MSQPLLPPPKAQPRHPKSPAQPRQKPSHVTPGGHSPCVWSHSCVAIARRERTRGGEIGPTALQHTPSSVGAHTATDTRTQRATLTLRRSQSKLAVAAQLLIQHLLGGLKLLLRAKDSDLSAERITFLGDERSRSPKIRPPTDPQGHTPPKRQQHPPSLPCSAASRGPRSSSTREAQYESPSGWKAKGHTGSGDGHLPNGPRQTKRRLTRRGRLPTTSTQSS